MTEWIEWDAFPDLPKRRRMPRVERIQVLPPPPEPSRLHRVEINVRQHRRAPSYFLPIFLAVAAIVLLWRLRLGVLLAAILGREMIGMFLFVGACLALLAWRDHRSSRPF
jgi:hypothetical protein